mmetsp:Transcript_33669/g.73504  ORF Transcript_33669/g.73504 Transcript_33669/m.73504 type:complete len:484 (-) Transcript_33669:1369-2820(-)
MQSGGARVLAGARIGRAAGSPSTRRLHWRHPDAMQLHGRRHGPSAPLPQELQAPAQPALCSGRDRQAGGERGGHQPGRTAAGSVRGGAAGDVRGRGVRGGRPPRLPQGEPPQAQRQVLRRGVPPRGGGLGGRALPVQARRRLRRGEGEVLRGGAHRARAHPRVPPGARGGGGLQRGVQSRGGEVRAGGCDGLAAGLAAAHVLLQGRQDPLQRGALGRQAVDDVGGVEPHLRAGVPQPEHPAGAVRALQAAPHAPHLHGRRRHPLRHAHGGGLLQGDPLRLPRRQAGRRPHPDVPGEQQGQAESAVRQEAAGAPHHPGGQLALQARHLQQLQGGAQDPLRRRQGGRQPHRQLPAGQAGGPRHVPAVPRGGEPGRGEEHRRRAAAAGGGVAVRRGHEGALPQSAARPRPRAQVPEDQAQRDRVARVPHGDPAAADARGGELEAGPPAGGEVHGRRAQAVPRHPARRRPRARVSAPQRGQADARVP